MTKESQVFDMRLIDPNTGKITTLQPGDLFSLGHVTVAILRKNNEERWSPLMMWTLNRTFNNLSPRFVKPLSKTIAALVGAAQGLGIRKSEILQGYIFVKLNQ